MSVSEQTPIQSYTANGVTSVFPFLFYVGNATDIVVDVDGIIKTLGVDYTVSGLGNDAGGNVTMLTPPLAGLTVTVYRDTPLERLEDFQTAGDLPADELDRQFDRLWQALQEIFSGGKGAPTALRVPNGESIPALPAAALRAGRLVGFDSLGRPIATLPTAGDATALALDLASSNAAAKGSGQIGYSSALNYAAGTIGAALKTLGTSGGGFKNAKKDFACVGDGTTDDTVAFQNAVTQCENNGWALFVPAGTYKLTSTIVQTKRLHLFGEGPFLTVLNSSASEAYRVAVPYGSGLTFCYWHDFSIEPSVGGGGTNGFVMRLVSDSGSVCYCSNWTMERVRIGDFGGYGLNLDNSVGNLNGFFTFTIRRCWVTNGMILNKVGDSVNVEENTITDGATIQAAKIGGRIGILYTGLSGARQVVIRSNNITTSGGFLAAINCEQMRFEKNQCEHPVYYYIPYYANDPTGAGVYGAGIYLYNSYGAVLRDNTFGAGSVTTTTASGTTTNGSPTVTGLSATTNIYKGCTVRGTGIPANTRVSNIVGSTVTLTQNATASGTPSLTFGYSPDSTVFLDGGTIKTVFDSNDVTSGTYWHYTISSGSYDNTTFGTSTYAGAATTAVLNDQNTAAAYNGIEDAATAYPQGNLFYNAFVDIWNGTDPTNTYCAGITANGAATASRDTVTVYPGNPSQVALAVTSSGTTINNGCDITPANQPWRETGWISGAIAIYTNNASSGGVDVFFVNGGTVTKVGRAAATSAWTLVRFRCRINAGNNWGVRLATSDGLGTYTNGWGFKIGGVHLCRGPHMPTTIEEAPSRRSFVVTGSVSYAPTFQGQRAFLTGTGKWYLAANSLLASDWILLN